MDVQPILNGIQGTFETVWGAIQAAIQAVVDIVGRVTEAISGFKSFLDGLQLRNPFEGIAAAGQGCLTPSARWARPWAARTAIRSRRKQAARPTFPAAWRRFMKRL